MSEPEPRIDEVKCNILLVDDRLANLVALESILDRPDYRIVKATSGEEGLRCLKEDSFAVILLDVTMPQMDGFELARLTKDIKKNASTPIIFVTAVASDEKFVAKGYAHGAADYMTKPLDPEEVKAKVAVFVDLYNKNHRLELAESRLLALNADLEKRVAERAKELAISNERFRLFVDGVKDYGFIQMDKEGKFITWNTGAERLLGYCESEIIGLPFAKIFTPDDIAQGIPNKELTTAIATGRADDTRWHMRKDGSIFWAQGITTALRDEKGNISGFAKVLHDYTEGKRNEDALIKSEQEALEAKRAAEAANRSKSMFLANISHEIRTPLSAIIGFSELLRQSDISEQERLEFINIIIRNGSALSTLIDDVLDLSKIEAGEIKIERLPVSLPNLISDVMTSLTGKAREKKIALDFTPPHQIPVIIETDPMRLRQILINIIGNAIKFTERGSVSIQISIQSPRDKPLSHNLLFLVKDTGKGMSEAEQQAIFRPFNQGDPSTTRRYGGTGLGLVLSKKLAHALGGDVKLIESEENRGSTFMITIDPGNVYHREEDHDSIQGHWDSSLMQEYEPQLRGFRVLLAEDAQDNQILITRILKKSGLDVETANNGAEAIDRAESGQFHIVLMDIQMPILDGNDAIETLRARGYKGPIIALTAHAMLEEREKSLKAGANDHLSKPINAKKLLYVISQYVRTGFPAS